MITGNLHTHTLFSDGSSPPEAYVEEAVRQGFSVLGFTDHSPVSFPNTFAIPEERLSEYVDEIQRIKRHGKWDAGCWTRDARRGTWDAERNIPDQRGDIRSRAYTKGTEAEIHTIEILLGLEYDYIPGLTPSIQGLRKRFPLDYFIGSVHLVRNEHPGLIWFIDGPDAATYDKGLREMFGGDARIAVTAYWRQIQEMVVNEKPEIIGHLDKIKMHNRGRYFSEEDPWYVSLVDETLDMIRECGMVVEVNTRGLYKKRSGSLFPGPPVLKKILVREIPVTLTSDAHSPAELSLLFPGTIDTLKAIGFKNQWLLTGKGWMETGL